MFEGKWWWMCWLSTFKITKLTLDPNEMDSLSIVNCLKSTTKTTSNTKTMSINLTFEIHKQISKWNTFQAKHQQATNVALFFLSVNVNDCDVNCEIKNLSH